MMRGQQKCIVTIENKGEDEPTIIAPDYFTKTFFEIGAANSAKINLIEYKNYAFDSEDGEDEMEGMEDEMEEMEAEQDEGEEKEPEKENDPEEQPSKIEGEAAENAAEPNEAP